MARTALSDALRRDRDEYQVPVPWRSMRTIEPLRGNLAILLGAPGMGKSAVALNWVLKIDEPSCVLSLDTDLTTQAVRAASILSGKPMSRIKADPKPWARYLEQKVTTARFYDLSLNIREINDLLKAEAEYWGESPSILVVDNVSNLIQEGGYEEYRKVFTDLHRVARLNNTFILALHHIGRDKQSKSALTLSSGQYTGEQEAEMVLGLTSRHDDTLDVSFLKNRSGRADPGGGLFVTLSFIKDVMRVEDLSAEAQAKIILGGGRV